ncbi:peptidoglycan-binding domain-containing protein [Streptomyces olivoreticuli]|uniref:peptidoglycan-binding domain-containing protein n=1 Tax=Streptomyces olivoreticuli TaxID=68246 RepID=UPI00265A2BEF|nr:peptidoglycan-binding domain-containing protein [Streptomyces olivoreticuli]WKK24334.1 peptidoglycan-binding domain-containing protein [Streptomyces olivoreticuli]
MNQPWSATAQGDRRTLEPTSPTRTRPAPDRTKGPGRASAGPTATAGSRTGTNTPRSAAPSATDKARENPHPSPSPTPSSPDTIGVLKQGDSGPAVEAMQHMLHRLGLYHGHRYGLFDDRTEESIRRFQTWAAVADEVKDDEDGTYGPATRSALLRWAS